jgi:hypothetical protein
MSREYALRGVAAEYPKGLQAIQAVAVRHMLFGTRRGVAPSVIEPDGRRAGRALRRFIEAGLMEGPADRPGDDPPEVVAEAALATISPETVDLREEWDRAFDWSVARTHRPLVWVHDGYRALMPLSKVAALFAAGDAIEWDLYAAAARDHDRHALSAAAVRGPVPRGELAGAFADVNARAGVRESWGVAVGCAALTAFAAFRIEEESVIDALPRNLAWGLKTLGILVEDEAALVPASLRVPFPLPGGGSVLPAEWPAKFDELVDHDHGKIDDASRRLRVLEKVRRGVAARGGWDAFLLAYTDAVRAALAALRKEGADDEPDR